MTTPTILFDEGYPIAEPQGNWYGANYGCVATVVVAQIVHVIWFGIIAYILKRDWKKRKSDITIDTDPYPKWLNMWSTLSISLYLSSITVSFIYFFFLWSKDIVLHMTLSIIISTIGDFALISVTIYQITRLQYCFSEKQVHSKKYGYSKRIFKVLYSMGFLLCFISIFSIIYPSYYLTSEYKKDGVYSDGNIWSYLFFSCGQSLIYYLWDGMVLFLFIYKMYQIRTITEFKEEHIYKRINFILKKITTLTVLFQIKGYILLGIAFCSTLFLRASWITYTISWMVSDADSVISALLIYFMIERNNDEYMKFIQMCCGLSRDDVDEPMETKSTKPGEDMGLENTRTNSIEIEMNKYIDNSEITQTVM